MTSELEKYRKYGMPDCLGKPFTSQELWHTLLKYLVPISTMPIVSDPTDEHKGNSELQKKLKVSFAKSNQNKFADITKALLVGDVTLAHRLAHSLKGNAGQIGKSGLQHAAAKIESLLHEGKVPIPDEEMDILKFEFTLVIEELKPLLDESAKLKNIRELDENETIALLNKLKPMLDNINPECLTLLDGLYSVAGAEELTRQIEDYDFETAAVTLAALMKKVNL
jgi:HPt (histidine-containing phosphotransfer) domain-containing protein